MNTFLNRSRDLRCLSPLTLGGQHMPAVLPPSGAGAAQPTRVRQVRPRQAEDDKRADALKKVEHWQTGQRQLFGMMMRQTLRNSRHMREVMAALFDVCPTPTTLRPSWRCRSRFQCTASR
ncbi:unnamed protein product [Prorocentrum cordatum]|uniref:Uncharacterized protein n=1 Tax=Prorocentrum cordatum TaxID=2364126 RepID=A0ABN9Q209_9DINO|nr:unnamed protein product [Polarella glacialis]